MDAVLLSAACCMCVGHCRRAAAAPAPAQRTASPPHALCLRGGVGGAMPAQMSRIPGVKILSHTPMRLDKTQRWLEATTFDGSDVSSPWMGTWSGDNYTKTNSDTEKANAPRRLPPTELPVGHLRVST